MNYIQLVRDILAQKVSVESDLLDLYTLLVLTTGIDTELIDVHYAWVVWRNKTNPSHKSLIPFSELSEQTKELDREYADAIRATAASTQDLRGCLP